MMNRFRTKKGFTLIELLVVIGVLAVIAAGVVALIDPVDKTRAANDSKVQSDIGQMATALQSYAASSPTGAYPPAGALPGALAVLVTNGDLASVPSAPTGRTYTFVNGGLVNGVQNVCLTGTLGAKKYSTTPVWQWSSRNGTAGPVAAGTACP